MMRSTNREARKTANRQKLIEATIDAIAELGLSDTTVWRMEKKGEFPRRRQLSQKNVGWPLSEILAWMAGRAPAGSHG